MKTIHSLILFLLFTSGCAVEKKYNPSKKFSPQQLSADYSLFRNILEESHPSLYWYTPKDSIDYYFEKGASLLKDSLTESKFRNVLSYVVSKIRCGHTSVRASKGAQNYFNSRASSFPLFVKGWPDTVVVTANLNRKDSNIIRGVVLKSIDNKPINTIIDSFFSHLSSDGYNTTHKYQTISNGSNFRSMYSSLFGLKSKVPVQYIDTLGNLNAALLNIYTPVIDSSKVTAVQKGPSKKERKKMRLQSARSFRIDTALNTAFLEVNTFTKHNKLRSFFKNSFKEIKKNNIANLVVDMRANGGGSVTLSNLLTKYIADQPFKIADSLYAKKRGSRYGQYKENHVLNWLFLQFLTRKKEDGNYHFTLFENKYFKPKSTNHFNGTTYILTGGNTFSAATLFTHALEQQPNVIVVGEETGGGAYGNSAWLIPDVTLPHTEVIFRLPLFRLVIDKDTVKGRGVLPEVEAVPTVHAIRNGEDFKMDKVKELIRKNQIR